MDCIHSLLNGGKVTRSSTKTKCLTMPRLTTCTLLLWGVTPVLTSTNCWPPHECQLLFAVNPHSLLAYMCYFFSLFQYYTAFFYIIPCGGRKTREAGDKSSEQDVDKARWFNSAQQGENQQYTVPTYSTRTELNPGHILCKVYWSWESSTFTTTPSLLLTTALSQNFTYL